MCNPSGYDMSFKNIIHFISLAILGKNSREVGLVD